MPRLLAERELLTATATMGQNQSTLAGRACVPCPAFLDCSQLAVVEAPHEVVGSRYPISLPLFGPVTAVNVDRMLRADLVYATALVACLHPTVCNRPAPPPHARSWPEWAPLVADGTINTADFSRYLCREGHDAASLLCSRCLDRYWLQGFLCQPCGDGATLAAVSVLVGVAMIVALAVYVRHRILSHEVPPSASELGGRALRVMTDESGGTAPQRASEDAETTSIALWYLQVSSLLLVSTQINSARTDSGRGDGTDTVWRSWLDQLVSFSPWAAECIMGQGWTFTVSSLLLLSLPWLILAAASAATCVYRRQTGRWLAAACILFDLAYLPVVARALAWLNVDHAFADYGAPVCRPRGCARAHV